MKLLDFEAKSCERIRNYLDAYLSSELLVETSLEVLGHLERCPRCERDLSDRQRLKASLKSAILRQPPAPRVLERRVREWIQAHAP